MEIGRRIAYYCCIREILICENEGINYEILKKIESSLEKDHEKMFKFFLYLFQNNAKLSINKLFLFI